MRSLTWDNEVGRLAFVCALILVPACIPFGDGSVRAHGVVVTPTGVPVANARVIAQSGDSGIAGTQSDENGCFDLWRMAAPGWWRFDLIVEAPGHTPVKRRLWANHVNHVVVTLDDREPPGSGVIEKIGKRATDPGGCGER